MDHFLYHAKQINILENKCQDLILENATLRHEFKMAQASMPDEVKELREKIEAWKNLSVALDKRIVGLEKIMGCAKLFMELWDKGDIPVCYDFAIAPLNDAARWLDRSIKMYEKDERE